MYHTSSAPIAAAAAPLASETLLACWFIRLHRSTAAGHSFWVCILFPLTCAHVAWEPARALPCLHPFLLPVGGLELHVQTAADDLEQELVPEAVGPLVAGEQLRPLEVRLSVYCTHKFKSFRIWI